MQLLCCWQFAMVPTVQSLCQVCGWENRSFAVHNTTSQISSSIFFITAIHSRPAFLLCPSFRSVVGNLFTTTGQKTVAIFVAGHTHNSNKGTHNIDPYFSPLATWRAALELFAGHGPLKLPIHFRQWFLYYPREISWSWVSSFGNYPHKHL